MVVTLWAISSARWKLIHEGEHQSPMSTHMFVKRYLDDLQLAIPKQRTRAPAHVTAATRRWVPLPASFHKLNVDAAVDKNGQKGSISVVCRNEEGLYAGSSTLVYQGLTDPMILEALVCRKALALAKDLMLQQLTVVSDCKSVVMDIHTCTMGAMEASQRDRV